MDMPKPGDAHKKLGRLIGQWSGPETMHPAPWDQVGGPATATVNNHWVANGFAVVQDYEQRREGSPNFSGHGVFWYDSAKDQYVMTWWDSMAGTAGEFRGQFNGDVLELSSRMPQGGQSRAFFDLGKTGQYAFRMEISEDGEAWQPAMEGEYRKSGGATAKALKRSAKAAKATRQARPARAAKKAAAKRPTARKAKKAGRRR
jgi:hypothetical protein